MNEIEQLRAQTSTQHSEIAADAKSALCLEVIAEHWSQKTGGTKSQFESTARKQLHAEGASSEALNSLYMQAIKDGEIAKRGTSAGTKVIEDAQQAWHCK